MDGSKQKIVLGFDCARGYEVQALIMVRSLRQFGGTLSDIPVWIVNPNDQELDAQLKKTLMELDVRFLQFQIQPSLLKFPFAAKAVAASKAETQAEKDGVTLAWHDRTGMIRQAPTAFFLPEDKAFGFRPTDIANIGAPYGKPLPPFWQSICEHFELTPDDLPAITSVIDQQKLHLYINAGLLVVRPAQGILRAWAENLERTYHLPEFKQFYQQNQAYAIFMHQAALTAAVVQKTSPAERMILPDTYLFSVDNFFVYPSALRPESLDEIVTGRFHDFYALEDWESLISASEEMVDWFKTQLQAGAYWPDSSA